MSLTKKWANGIGSMPLSTEGTPQLNAADLAAVDQNEQQALDKGPVGSTVFSTLTAGAGGAVSLDSPDSAWVVTGSVAGIVITDGGTGYGTTPAVSLTGGGGTGATAVATVSLGAVVLVIVTNPGYGYTSAPAVSFSAGAATATATMSWCETSGGGRFQSGNNDFPLTSVPVVVRHFFNFEEMFSNLLGSDTIPWPYPTPNNRSWYLDPVGAVFSGTSTGTPVGGLGKLVVPITRIHDGAVISSVQAYFKVSASRTTLPTDTVYPSFNLYQYDPFLNVATSLFLASGSPNTNEAGWNFYPGPSPNTLAAYRAGVNTLLETVSFTVDLGKYLYFLAVQDESYAGESLPSLLGNEWVGFSLTATVSDLHFQ